MSLKWSLKLLCVQLKCDSSPSRKLESQSLGSVEKKAYAELFIIFY